MPTNKITLSAETFAVPLNRLSRDPQNVRRTETATEIEALADDIAGHGLLHNLGVRPGERTGDFLVSIGGRRLAALNHLVATKRLAKTAPIPCRALDPQEATSAGLAENLSRIAMHPADAYVAFAALIEQGKAPADVAQRFGVSEQTVTRRMRLGRLSPAVLDAYREGRIGEDAARAFALTTDHAAQERVLAELSRTNLGAYAIRRMLTEADVPAHDARSRFVTLAAYEAAGGTVRRDLFAEYDHNVTLADPELLNRLTQDGLERVAERVRAEGWQRVTVQIDSPDRTDLIGWACATPSVHPDPTPEDAEQFGTVADRIAELETKDELTDEEDEELTRLEAQKVEIEERGIHYDTADTARGWAVVYLGAYGDPNTARLVPIAPDDPAALVPQRPVAEDEHRQTTETRSNDDAGKLTAALTATLRGQRTIALQAHVAERPGLALRLLAQALLMGREHASYDAPMRISLATPQTISYDVAQEVAETPARKALDEAHERREDQQPGEHRDLLPWLLRMEDFQVIDLLAPLLAGAVEAGTVDWTERGDGLAAQAARAAEYDPSPWWTATAETYFGRVSKELIGAAVSETGERVNLSAKKKELAAEATRKVAGTGWVPTLLRAPPAANDDGIHAAAD